MSKHRGKAITKPGKYGKLYLYELVYDDGPESMWGQHRIRKWAYSYEAAIERFLENNWEEFRLAKIACVHEGVQQVYHEVNRF